MHTLICGVTESGKTTLAHKLADFDAKAPDKEKKIILVYDPVLTATKFRPDEVGWPDHAELFTDKGKFLNYVARIKAENYSIYIDEAGDIFPQHDNQHVWIMTRGRHLGFSVTLICQRPKMVLPSARNQCTRFCVFRLGAADMREMAADTGHNEWASKKLDQGEFLCAYSGRAQFTQANIFNILKEGKASTSWKNICTPPLSPSQS